MAKKTNSFAIASLVCGILVWFLGWIPLIGFLVIIAAVVLGIVALKQISKKKQPGKGMAIAGIVLGVLGLFFVMLASIMLFMLIGRVQNMQASQAQEIDMIAYSEDWDRDDVIDGIEFTLYPEDENASFTGKIEARIYRSVIDMQEYAIYRGGFIKGWTLDVQNCGSWLGCEVKLKDEIFAQLAEAGVDLLYLEVKVITPGQTYTAYVDDISLE
jgi:hypothetical protein